MFCFESLNTKSVNLTCAFNPFRTPISYLNRTTILTFSTNSKQSFSHIFNVHSLPIRIQFSNTTYFSTQMIWTQFRLIPFISASNCWQQFTVKVQYFQRSPRLISDFVRHSKFGHSLSRRMNLKLNLNFNLNLTQIVHNQIPLKRFTLSRKEFSSFL